MRPIPTHRLKHGKNISPGCGNYWIGRLICGIKIIMRDIDYEILGDRKEGPGGSATAWVSRRVSRPLAMCKSPKTGVLHSRDIIGSTTNRSSLHGRNPPLRA
jgi:hypothetical protein